MVVAIRLRDEPVVVRVVDSAEEDPVEFEQPAGLIDLVFDFGSLRNLNDGVDYFWRFRAGSDAVPGVEGEGAHGGQGRGGIWVA